MELPIYVYGTDILREPTKEVTPDLPGLQKLIADMYDTMYASDGIGLAAPQVGKALQLFVIDASPLKDAYPETADMKHTFINAEVLEYGTEEVTLDEGCLSLPGLSEPVSRPTMVRVKYQDESFEWHEETFRGFSARVFQHEFDHTRGILFTDKVPAMRKAMIRSKLKKMSRGNIRADYKIITNSR